MNVFCDVVMTGNSDAQGIRSRWIQVLLGLACAVDLDLCY